LDRLVEIVHLSVLDQSPISEGSTGSQALKVAESFSLLAGLFPGRIDLGIGRAAGTDPMTTFALQRDRRQATPDDFPEQLAELLAYFDDAFPASHALARLVDTLPGRPEQPAVWLLGSSPQSAIWAGELGLPHAFADFINPRGAEIAQLYRDRFEPSERLAAPRTAVAVWAVAADSDAEAERLASSSPMSLALLRQGRLIAVPPPDKALRFLDAQGNGAAGAGRRAVVGAPQAVRAGIQEVSDEYGAEQVIVVTITFDHAARRRSYQSSPPRSR
jgi:luciferase family oxidoreductase group 1